MSVFLTEAEMNAAFVQNANYVDPIEVAVSGTLPAPDGFHVVFADTSGGALSLALPASPPERYEPWIINVGGNDLNITGIINGNAGPHLIATQWFGIAIRNNGGDLVASVRSFVADPVALLVETQSFRSSPAEAGARFGLRMAMNAAGTRAAIGASYENNGGTDRGAVYVFDHNGTNWVQTQRLTPSTLENNASFGIEVDMNDAGDRIVVGAWLEDVGGSNRGAAYVFDLAGTWSETQKLTAPTPTDNDAFGIGVAVDGNTILVGAAGAGVGGEVYEFTLSGTWSVTQTLTPIAPQAGAQFGNAISLQGNRAVIGALSYDNAFSNEGAVYVFDKAGTWSETQQLFSSGGDNGSAFGESVSLDGNRFVAGSPSEASLVGAAYVFDLSGTWSETQRLSPVGADRFGREVAIQGDVIVVTSPNENDGGDDRGAAYQFELDGVWNELGRLVPSDRENFQFFGEAMAFKGNRALFFDLDALDSTFGTVYAFQF